MDFDYLQKLNYSNLRKIGEDMGITIPKKKDELIHAILACFKEYEEYKKEKIDKYTRVKQIGNEGKEGVTYLVKTSDNQKFAMKTFRKSKSSAKIKQEADLQHKASLFGIAPKVIEIDTVSKYIVMEKLDTHLVDIMKTQNGDLSEEQQKDIIFIFNKLDEACVFQGDSNILNYMYKSKKLYIIDFGMAKLIDEKLKKKLKTDKPNFTIMNLGFILKLKELNCPETAYSHLLTHVSEYNQNKYGLNKKDDRKIVREDDREVVRKDDREVVRKDDIRKIEPKKDNRHKK